MDNLWTCAAARWWPSLGDPTPWGWAATLLFALASVVAARTAVRLGGRDRLLWAVAAALMAALALNKQLDLQILLTATGRCLAQAQGWFEARRAVQATFVAALAVAVVLALVGLARAGRGTRAAGGWVIAGLGLTGAFVLWRAALFHHMESEALHHLTHLYVPQMLEGAGPAALILGGLTLRG